MKKFISVLLALTLIIPSINVVLAGSTNSVTAVSKVLINQPVKNENGEYAKLLIQPRNEIETGDSIIISVEGGRFDSELFNDCAFRSNKSGTTYEAIVATGLDIYDALVKFVGNEGSREIPYGFRYINESELEIKLYPIEDYKVNCNNTDVTKGTPIYNIALPVVAGDKEGYVKITIDDNDTSVTGNATYNIARSVTDINIESDIPFSPNSSISISREIAVGKNQPVKINGKPNELVIMPRAEVKDGDYIRIKIKNGSFDEAMLEECAFATNKTYTSYDEIVSAYLSNYDALVNFVGNQDSRQLPYKLTYIDSETLKVELFPIQDSKVNQYNSDVTKGIPVYKVKIPAVAGSEDSTVDIDIYGTDSTKPNGGSYILAYIDKITADYSVNNNYFAQRDLSVSKNQPIKYNDKFNSIIIEPVNCVDEDSSIFIKIKNGSFDEASLDECAFKTNKTSTTYDQIVSKGLTSYDSLVRFIGDENSRELPYKLTYIDSETLKVELFPIQDSKVNQYNSDVTQGIPIYNIALPAVAGSESGITQVAIDPNSTTLSRAGWYTVATVDSDIIYNKYNNVSVSKEVVTIPGKDLADREFVNSSTAINLEITPQLGIEYGTKIYIHIKNGSFDKELTENYIYKTNKTYTTYDQIVASGLQPHDALVKYVGNESSRQLPYKLNYISEDTVEAELFPLEDTKAYQNNSSGDVTYGTPIYSIALPAVAGSEIGMISVAIDGNNSTIKNSGYYDIGRVLDPTDSFEPSVVLYDIPVTYDKNIVLPDITIKEIYPGAFKEGKISIKINDGCKFKDNSSSNFIITEERPLIWDCGIAVPGLNCSFDPVYLNGYEDELIITIKDYFYDYGYIYISNFDDSKISSIILKGIEIVADDNFTGDVNITVSGDGLSTDITKTIKAAEIVKYDGSEIKGDADNDGVITANDTSIVINRVLNNAEYISKLDVNDDGVINSADAAQILQKSLDSSYEYTSDN